MKIFRFSFLVAATLIFVRANGQHLKPGFDKNEYIELLKIGAHTTANSKYYDTFPAPQHFKLLYQSPEIGLDNLWQLWLNDDSVAVISVRGTTATATSFLANLYAAMVSAKGQLHLSNNFTFVYDLSDNPKAAVHIGYLISTAYLSGDIVPKIDSLYHNGIKNFIITGHSQGGAITYLLTSYLESLKAQNKLPKAIRFKTYSSASPKPGNLYYAYQYENMTRGGWAFNVVNTADWVPEVPFSVQTVNDFNEVNPFIHSKAIIKKQKFPLNIGLRHVYNRLIKPSGKAQKNFEKFLGKKMAKYIKKKLPEFQPPAYFKSNDYVRTGATIVLYADSDYYNKFPQDGNKVWQNHGQVPYLYLAKKLPGDMNNTPDKKLNGTWELNYISGRRIAFKGLYPEKVPFITINTDSSRINGNTSCNVFSGKLEAAGNKINFTGPMAMTMMACPGEGEMAFLQTLKKIDSYAFEDENTLTFIMGDVVMMRFVRK